MAAEFHCCHGTPESGHSETCPYDKEFFGPEGVHFDAAYSRTNFNFHDMGQVQHGQHAIGSQYARAVEQPAKSKPTKAAKPPKIESESLF